MLPVGSQAPHRAEHEEIVDWLLRPDNNRNWGFGLCFLNLRIKPRKPLAREKLQPLSVPEAINQVWSMDFMHNQLEGWRSLGLFNVIDDFNREALGTKQRLAMAT